MRIELRNNTCRYILHPSEAAIDTLIRNYLTYKVDGYRFTTAYKEGRWDGNKCVVSKDNEFATGYLDIILSLLDKENIDNIDVVDYRHNPLIVSESFIEDLGNDDQWVLRDYQARLIKATLSNEVGGHPFIRGMWYAEPNSGKTSMMVGLIKNLVNVKALILIDRKKNFTQTYDFLAQCFTLGKIGLGELNFDHSITIAMVKTLYRQTQTNLDVVNYLQDVNLIICDEAHRAASNTYADILSHTNSYSTILMSGTLLDINSLSKKLSLFGMSGAVLGRITNKDLAKYNVSLKPIVDVYLNDTFHQPCDVYREDYQHIVIESIPRICCIIDQYKLDPTQIMLVAVQYVEHAKLLYEKLTEALDVRVEYSHGQDKYREPKLKDLIAGNINIFISTSILQESLNIPCITTIVYALGGRSKVAIKQWKGRGARVHKPNGRDTVRIIDFWDVGFEKQCRDRIATYKKEGYEVNINYPHSRFYTPKFGI